MVDEAKCVEHVTPEEWRRFPVREFDVANESLPGRDESWVVPVTRYRVWDLTARVVGTGLTLANGATVLGVLGSVDLLSPRHNRQFMSVSIYRDGAWYYLLRPVLVDQTTSGPSGLARFLGLSLGDVFPIRYDISDVAIGLPRAVRGEIVLEQRPRPAKEPYWRVRSGWRREGPGLIERLWRRLARR